jgi:branched-subunit amino acid ABC-type transport system permease component
LSIIFGMLRIVNFAHGVMYMLGAFVAYYGAQLIHLPFFAALIVAPIVVGAFGLLIEVTLLRRLYDLDPLYNLLLTFALVLVIEDVMRLAAGRARLAVRNACASWPARPTSASPVSRPTGCS